MLNEASNFETNLPRLSSWPGKLPGDEYEMRNEANRLSAKENLEEIIRRLKSTDVKTPKGFAARSVREDRDNG